ncbi:ATP-binding protein [Paenibacillus eucommiae]|uniref:histidine kinase n=1 Tax=Paenibacillus eucommiae TaxID=1355755 RepID=A0ABS4IZ95_9BACL|nr:ATP-binding protein [Paenibacillus eucommiae]MBP1992914.1 two-component system sensor histidine kinase ComP [Paenibacillus eucommiae]
MKKKVAISIFVSILIFVQIWCFFISFKYPYIGLYLETNPNQEWIVREIDKKSLSSELDIKLGDRITEIDGGAPEDFWTVAKWRAIEQAHSVTVSRDGQEPKLLLTNHASTNYGIFSLFSGLVTLFLALLLYLKIPNSPSARLLAFVFLAIGLTWTGIGASSRGDIIGKILVTSLMMAIPFIFYHFLVIFFQEKGKISLPKKALKYVYVLIGLGFGIRLLYFIPALAYPIYLYNGKISLLFFIIGFLLNIYMLTYIYFKHRKPKSYLSSIIKSVWISLIISFLPSIILSFIPRLKTGSFFLDEEFTSLFILFLPISFTYLIAADRLYDIGLVVRRFVSAGMISLLPSAMLTGAYVVLFSEDVEVKHLLFIFFAPLILISLILYSMEYVTTKFESFLFPRKSMLHTTLKKISKNLGAISSFRELKDIVLVDIVKTLDVIGGAIVIQYKDEIETVHEGVINLEEIKQLLSSSSLQQHPFYSCIEINHHEDYTGYLVMTGKKTNTMLGKEELQWLNLIISYLAVSMENVHLIRKLTSKLQQLAAQLPNEQSAQDIQWFRKLMFELQEEERIRIANDLHDTTMQDLFFLKRRFIELLEGQLLNKDDKEQLNNIINFIELINTGLRQSCFELHPHLLQEIGLILTVQRLLDKETYNCPFTIQFTGVSAYAIENRDLVSKKHIFRIVQELLSNAKKHSHATEVTFTMTVEAGLFYLSYEDNGVGLDEVQAASTRLTGRSGIGMEQIKSRVLHLNGDIEMNSKAEGGVHFLISIPIIDVVAV